MIVPAGSLVVDYSWARPSPQRLAELGVRAVCRYLANRSSKVLTAEERDALHAAGIGILLNWEQSETDPLIPAKGTMHGRSALRQATALGYPADLPIIVSVDTDTVPTQWGTVQAYMKAFAAECAPYRLGVYAEAGLANRLVDAGLAWFVWAPSAVAWNDGIDYVRCDVRQHFGHAAWPQMAEFGVNVDSNTTLTPIRVWLPELGAALVPEEVPDMSRTIRARMGDSGDPNRDPRYWWVQSAGRNGIAAMNGAKMPANAPGGWELGMANEWPAAWLSFTPNAAVVDLDDKLDSGGNWIGPQLVCADGGHLVLPVA